MRLYSLTSLKIPNHGVFDVHSKGVANSESICMTPDSDPLLEKLCSYIRSWEGKCTTVYFKAKSMLNVYNTFFYIALL